MSEVKDVMNDIYLAYKRYKSSDDLGEYNHTMGQLTKKYKGDRFYTNIAMAFAARISEEREMISK